MRVRFRAKERRRAEELVESGFFCDEGQGVYRGTERKFVLEDPRLNLWAGIREDALEYFDEMTFPGTTVQNVSPPVIFFHHS